ncbi:MerR family transcriptional regulator [Mesobacillus maritimus]|uniref:MerR family transcriptional regulator n=1 Tax=Mesobacillus maritimus TaxID=1643336 RepID=UPI00203EFD56|nr:MerR family transcriptional regulator [Mesobacillus maritimus]MCM3584477.1 MerR family transcriptional regulator [Mesobacillus maritimus]MCM3670790.1 MerR family transcriptional regulator [Mesobacillus maritimus]
MNQFMKAYTIKEVSKKINVPSGTIRQWEKDLNGLLAIPRTRQGARFYTDKEIKLLENVKQMRSKNLSKDMIRELMKKHMNNMSSEENVEQEDQTNLPIVAETNAPAEQTHQFDVEGFFNALEVYKQDLLQDVRAEIRNGLRTQIVDEVKKDIASNSLQTIKALSLSIQRSKDRMKADLSELSQQVTDVSERSSDSFATLSEVSLGTAEKVTDLSEDVTKLSKGTTKEISNLTSNVTKITNGTKREVAAIKENLSKLTKGTTKNISSLSESVSKLSEGTYEEMRNLAAKLDESSEEFKILTDYLSKNNEMTTSELSTMNEQLAMDREYYLETLKLEREQFRNEIHKRDEIFKDMVVSYREAAAAKGPEKKWWKLWK